MQFFSSTKRLQEIFFQNHPPPPPSRVKWSAPKIRKTEKHTTKVSTSTLNLTQNEITRVARKNKHTKGVREEKIVLRNIITDSRKFQHCKPSPRLTAKSRIQCYFHSSWSVKNHIKILNFAVTCHTVSIEQTPTVEWFWCPVTVPGPNLNALVFTKLYCTKQYRYYGTENLVPVGTSCIQNSTWSTSKTTY